MISLDSISHLNHSIAIVDAAGDALAIASDGSIAVTDNGGSLTVDGTVELGATTLAALESITVQNGAGAAAVNIQDGGNSITVDGTVAISGTVAVTQSTSPWVVSASDLDIRDLTHVSDSVKVGDGTDFLAINADGSINVQTVEAGYSSWSVIAASIDATVGGTQIAAAPLSGRLRIEVQNLGDKDVYVRQSTGVTSGNGFKIPKGSSWEVALDAGAAIYAIATGSSADLRIAQYAA